MGRRGNLPVQFFAYLGTKVGGTPLPGDCHVPFDYTQGPRNDSSFLQHYKLKFAFPHI